MKQTVHIVDDEEVVRDALQLLMGSVELDAMTYPSARAFLERVDSLDPDGSNCLVVDVRMRDMSGLELQAEMKRRKLERIPVIVISGHGDIAMAVRAMQAGAQTFLEKPVVGQDLIDQVFAALRPRRTPEAEAREVLARHRDKLTRRQREVFDLLVQGLQTKAVAAELELSPRTVEVHRAEILKRLEMPTFAALLATALDAGRSASREHASHRLGVAT